MIGIYARVSTEEQARSGFSLQDQIHQCKLKAGKTEVKEYIDDGASGEYLDRPELDKLRNDIRNNLISTVICYDPDRLSRKLQNALIIVDEFDRKGVNLIFVNGDYAKTAEGNLFFAMRGAIAEFEKAKINERMSNGRKSKARQGKVLRDFSVYGYDFDKTAEQFTINESEAQVVKMIFDLFTKPNSTVHGINGIAKHLTKLAIPTKRNAVVWHRQVVRQILMNRAYIGEFYQNKWNTEGMLGNKSKKSKEEKIKMKLRPKDEWIQLQCPLIIESAQFDYAQVLLHESKRRWAKESRIPYLLGGIIRCGHCNNTMTGRLHNTWTKKIREYSDIKNTAGAKFEGCGLRVNSDTVETFVWEHIVAWLNNPDEIASTTLDDNQNIAFEEVEITRLQKEIDKLTSARRRLVKLFSSSDDGIGEAEIRQELKELTMKEALITKQLLQTQENLSNKSNTEYNNTILQEAIDFYLSNGHTELSFDDKKELIRTIVREIRVFRDKIEIYTF